MKILHIIPSLRKGGAERIVLDICIELQKRVDTEVRLVTFSSLCEYPDLAALVNWSVIPSWFIPSITDKNDANLGDLESFVNEFEPDVIHTHLWEAEIVSRQLTYVRGRWFTHFHDNMRQLSRLSWPLSKQKLTDWYERHLMLQQYKKRDSHFISISQHCLGYAKANLPSRHTSNISLLANAINCERFARKGPRTKDDTLKIVSVGSLLPNKNHKFLVAVAICLKNTNIPFVFKIVGDGILREPLQALIASEGLTAYFELLGRIDSPESILWEADIFVHTAFKEAFGLVILEAMAAGLPVVTLNGGGNVDIMEQGGNGYIIDKPDAEIFADKIMQLWIDRPLYQSVSTYAAHYAEGFDIKKYATGLLSLYGQ